MGGTAIRLGNSLMYCSDLRDRVEATGRIGSAHNVLALPDVLLAALVLRPPSHLPYMSLASCSTDMKRTGSLSLHKGGLCSVGTQAVVPASLLQPRPRPLCQLFGAKLGHHGCWRPLPH